MGNQPIDFETISPHLSSLQGTFLPNAFVRGYGLGFINEIALTGQAIKVYVTSQADKDILLQNQSIPTEITLAELGITLPVIIEVIGKVTLDSESAPAA